MNDAEQKSFPFEPAPNGSADRFMLSSTVRFFWTGAPAKYVRRVRCAVNTPSGIVWLNHSLDTPRVAVEIRAGFCFDVSVAPSAPKAMPAAALHDFLYAHADMLAAHWRCTPRAVLDLADHWFLALMRHEDFALAETYFLGVSIFGFWYNRLGRWFRKRFRSSGDVRRKGDNMKKSIITAAIVFAASIGASAFAAQAGPQAVDGSFTLAASAASGSFVKPATSEALSLDRLVFYNSGTVTQDVTVVALDLGCAVQIARFPIAAGASTNLWPRRAEVAHTTTNAYPYLVQDLRFSVSTATNGSAQAFFYRLFGN